MEKVNCGKIKDCWYGMRQERQKKMSTRLGLRSEPSWNLKPAVQTATFRSFKLCEASLPLMQTLGLAHCAMHNSLNRAGGPEKPIPVGNFLSTNCVINCLCWFCQNLPVCFLFCWHWSFTGHLLCSSMLEYIGKRLQFFYGKSSFTFVYLCMTIIVLLFK